MQRESGVVNREEKRHRMERETKKDNLSHTHTHTHTQPGSRQIVIWVVVVASITKGLTKSLPLVPELLLLLWITVDSEPFTYISPYHSIIHWLSGWACSHHSHLSLG